MLSLLWPSPARLVMGDRPLTVVPLTLAGLGALEQWATGRIGTATDALRAIAEVPDVAERHDQLRRLFLLHQRGGVAYGAPEVGQWLATDDGCAEQLRLTVRVRCRRTGRMRRAPYPLCQKIVADASHEDWFRWAVFAWQAHPLDEIARAIDREIGAVWPSPRPRPGHETPPNPWGESVWAAIAATGWTFAEVGRLTLYQWDVVRSGGKDREQSYATPGACPEGIAPKDWNEAVWNKRSAFWAAERAKEKAEAAQRRAELRARVRAEGGAGPPSRPARSVAPPESRHPPVSGLGGHRPKPPS